MTTKMDSLFKIFLAGISDYHIIDDKISQEEFYSHLFDFYIGARAKFYRKCKKDLNTNYPDYESVPVGEEMLINDDLDFEEMDILSILMRVEYLKPIIANTKVLEQVMSDKDFQLTSQANHLNQLINLYRESKSEATRAMTKYTYRELGD